MKVLAVETATSWQSVAVVQGDRVLALVEQDAEGSHARLLMSAIDRALKQAGLTLRDLQGLAVSNGPGSFTGLRVGLATMLGFRAVLGIPLVLVPTLEALAWRHRDVTGALVPVLKSRKNELYWAIYEWLRGGELKVLSPEQVGAPAVLGRILAGIVPATLYGEGWLAYRNEIQQSADSKAALLREVPPDTHRPSAVAVALAAGPRFTRGEIAGTSIAPLYVQRPEAEIKFDEQQGQSAVERRHARVAQKLGTRKSRPRRPGTKTRT